MMTLEMNGSAKRGIGGAVHDHPAIAVRISSQSRVSGAASSLFDILSSISRVVLLMLNLFRFQAILIRT